LFALTMHLVRSLHRARCPVRTVSIYSVVRKVCLRLSLGENRQHPCCRLSPLDKPFACPFRCSLIFKVLAVCGENCFSPAEG
jgi:hypothetical protein